MHWGLGGKCTKGGGGVQQNAPRRGGGGKVDEINRANEQKSWEGDRLCVI